MRKPIVTFYSSISEFSDAVPSDSGPKRPTSFCGGDSFEAARLGAKNGHPPAVKRSERFMNKLEAEGFSLPSLSFEHSVAGAFPCVPSFLAGAPDAMLEPVQSPSDRSPIKVFASICCSGGIDSKSFEKRGVTILALVRKLQAVRPVELFIYADLYGHGGAAIPVIKIETRTVDLSSASYAIAHAGFLRQLCFAWGYDGRGFNGQWAWGISPTYSDALAKTRAALGASNSDLVIPGGYLHDDLIQKPIEWINDKLRKYANALESVA